jgi:hypothetical protein
MADPTLTEATIAAAIAKVDARVCVGRDRCFAFPDRREDVRETCTRKGRCKVSRMASTGVRESRDGWLGVRTGLV